MAEGDYQRLGCCGCGVPLIPTGKRGRPAKRCEPCRNTEPKPKERQPRKAPQRKESHAKKREPISKRCEACGAGFLAQLSSARFCSKRCKDRCRTPQELVCGNCHRIVRRRVRGGRSDAGKFCSRGCAFAFKARLGAEVDALRRIGVAWRREARRLQADERDAVRKAEALARRTTHCHHCGCAYVPSRGGAFCRNEVCVRARVRKARRDYRKNSEAGRRARRINRKARKLRQRGATVERFDDVEILERDRWRCKICGVRTPRELRGTFEPNAPEVDHVVAIANGGAHARWNVRCACRACNGAKADRGQIALPL